VKASSQIAIGLAASVLFFARPNLMAAAEGTTKFDGSWSVTLDAKVYKNPDGSIAEPFVRHFPATVKNGVLPGEIGPRGKPTWYELSGNIQSDGSAALRGDEITGAQKYNFTIGKKAPPGKGTPYTYKIVAHFDARHGTGRSTDERPRVFTFVKQE
jgi:hypothetical protein